ncbi:hypothetical protein GF327_04070 [Candidatus Woesearchaeota archaeon]|nr:hypothetical protein [Candidatus Woesearchaeota archaeon]
MECLFDKIFSGIGRELDIDFLLKPILLPDYLEYLDPNEREHISALSYNSIDSIINDYGLCVKRNGSEQFGLSISKGNLVELCVGKEKVNYFKVKNEVKSTESIAYLPEHNFPCLRGDSIKVRFRIDDLGIQLLYQREELENSEDIQDYNLYYIRFEPSEGYKVHFCWSYRKGFTIKDGINKLKNMGFNPRQKFSDQELGDIIVHSLTNESDLPKYIKMFQQNRRK